MLLSLDEHDHERDAIEVAEIEAVDSSISGPLFHNSKAPLESVLISDHAEHDLASPPSHEGECVRFVHANVPVVLQVTYRVLWRVRRRDHCTVENVKLNSKIL